MNRTSTANAYLHKAGPTVQVGFASQSIYYVTNITAAIAGSKAYLNVTIVDYGGI